MFECNDCKYFSSNKYSFNRHLKTNKHFKNTKNNSIIQNEIVDNSTNSSIKKYECNCGISFLNKKQLINHHTKCVIYDKINNNKKQITEEMKQILNVIHLMNTDYNYKNNITYINFDDDLNRYLCCYTSKTWDLLYKLCENIEKSDYDDKVLEYYKRASDIKELALINNNLYNNLYKIPDILKYIKTNIEHNFNVIHSELLQLSNDIQLEIKQESN